MAHLYDTTNNSCSASSPVEPDDISLFLQQFLIRSSAAASSSSSFPASFMRQHSSATLSDNAVLENQIPTTVPTFGRISLPESCPGLNSSALGCFQASTVANVSSSSVGTLDNEPDEYDCDSEEAIEAFVEEAVPNPSQQRNSSKRSRAAEVHNLSEKRRRSRINEKMKALQNLIPNSNKTDKASMLDEAIEYLKQLQLQVQMLTMRNGLSLYPICLPGMLPTNQISQMRMETDDENRSLNMNITKGISTDQDTSTLVADFSTMINPKSSFETESSIQAHFGPIQFPRSSRGISREEMLPFKNLNEDCSPTSLTGHHVIGAKRNSSIPFDAQAQLSNAKDNTLEACFTGGDLHHLSNLVHDPIFPPQLIGLPVNGGRQTTDNIKSESREF